MLSNGGGRKGVVEVVRSHSWLLQRPDDNVEDKRQHDADQD